MKDATRNHRRGVIAAGGLLVAATLGACGGKALCEAQGGPFKGAIPDGPAKEIVALLPKGTAVCFVRADKDVSIQVEAPDKSVAKDVGLAIMKAGWQSTGPIGGKPDDDTSFTLGLERRDGERGSRVVVVGGDIGGLWNVGLTIKSW
ncbi:MAG: hypothetical protein IT385_06185 [Deltaproteobacteria bacterium]|nr:hypothetical protein [Deltaproteobacteria bacterium]